MDTLTETFKELFGYLKGAGYSWQPQTPDWLIRTRKAPQLFSPLVRYFGLGVSVEESELISEGVCPELLQRIAPLNPAVSSSGSWFVPHHHWPAKPASRNEYIYFGRETLQLARCIQPYLEKFFGKKVLDIGCGSGGLSLDVASLAEEVFGMDCAPSAVRWARAAALAQGVSNVTFAEGDVKSTSEAEILFQGRLFDVAVFNPPMTIPRLGSKNPYRDGGRLGIELPCAFLDFAFRNLRPGGEVFCLVTNPIIHGRSAFFDQFDSVKWGISEMICLNDHFNQSLYREDQYHQLGIDRIELWFLSLTKTSRRKN